MATQKICGVVISGLVLENKIVRLEPERPTFDSGVGAGLHAVEDSLQRLMVGDDCELLAKNVEVEMLACPDDG